MTFQFGLIGYPIKHSLSPWIHEGFLKKCGLSGSYSIFEINPDESFSEALEEVKSKNVDGFNVTVPYKEKIIDYLDEIDEQAQHIGAVNTVLNQNGKWIGYNTDGLGYVRSLKSKYPEITDKLSRRILILGAGGAAKGIYYGLISEGFEDITIANRTIEKAKDIMAHDNSNARKQVVTIAEAEEQLDQYDIIIQTTSVGMRPEIDQSIVSIKTLKANAIISDIVYQPIMTSLLKQAKAIDAKIHLGHTMLLYQAQLAFEIWTDHNPKMDEMDEALQQILEGS